MKKKIFKQNFLVDQKTRLARYNQNPKLIWFTGLSGSGKTTLSVSLEKFLFKKGFYTYCLDGDNIRFGISKDLGFSIKDRTENIRRVSEVSKLFIDSGIIVLASFISPLISQREIVKNIVGKENFIEIFVSTPIETCQKRDVKGLYKDARKGLIKNFTGVTSEYQPPKNPNLVIDTSQITVQESVKILFNNLKSYINV